MYANGLVEYIFCPENQLYSISTNAINEISKIIIYALTLGQNLFHQPSDINIRPSYNSIVPSNG